MIVIDKQKRSVLGEGRNYQMGFAFLKKIAPVRLFETIQPISPCKDYLNDVVYSEATGKKVSAYGLNTSKENLFDEEKYAYLAIKIMPRQDGGDYGSLQKDSDNLNSNYLTLKAFMNYFDSALGLKKTQIYKTNEGRDGIFLVKFDKAWAAYTYSISLFSLLLRVGQFYDASVEPLDFLKSFSAFSPDVYLVKAALPKIIKILELKSLPVQDLTTLKPGTGIHNFGIMAFNF